jgi:hypothetical protein
MCELTWTDGVLSAVADGVQMVSKTHQVVGLEGFDLRACIDQQDAWTGARDCVRLDVVDGVRAR